MAMFPQEVLPDQGSQQEQADRGAEPGALASSRWRLFVGIRVRLSRAEAVSSPVGLMLLALFVYPR